MPLVACCYWLVQESPTPNPLVHRPALVHGLPGTGPCKEVKSHLYTYGATPPPCLQKNCSPQNRSAALKRLEGRRTNWVNKQNGEKVPSIPKPSSDCTLKLISLVLSHLRIPDHTKDKKPCISLFNIGNIGMLYCWCLFHFLDAPKHSSIAGNMVAKARKKGREACLFVYYSVTIFQLLYHHYNPHTLVKIHLTSLT